LERKHQNLGQGEIGENEARNFSGEKNSSQKSGLNFAAKNRVVHISRYCYIRTGVGFNGCLLDDRMITAATVPGNYNSTNYDIDSQCYNNSQASRS